ncbi:MAG: formamidopyrimidine-DNA glycosylase [Planctomycetota bacterium]|nr:formamidopyrimidine-DNA glycosylase [Planctomycetota bacterium]
MPEYPEVEAYLAALRVKTEGQVLRAIRLKSLFLVRTVDPPLASVHGKRVVGLERIGKRIVFAFEDEHFLVLHLMVTGRLRWRKPGAGLPGKAGLAAFDFDEGSLILTEASTQKRASLHLVVGRAALAAHDPGGIEPLECSVDEFRAALQGAKHTVKRALTSPKLVSGIGNWASDEILWEARLSPFKRVRDLSDDDWPILFEAIRATLTVWRERYVAAALESFPEKVSAFHPEMAVHGRFGEPCPRCGKPVQRIAFATKHESNYCARCQTGGKLLADRALSRLLKDDWPKTLEELE